MYKKILQFLLALTITFFSASPALWVTFPEQDELENLDIEYQSRIFIEDTLSLEVENLKWDLSRIYPNESFRFEWNVRGASTRDGEEVAFKFERVWEKKIDLNIFLENEEAEEWELLMSRELDIMVYSKSMPLFIQNTFIDSQHENFLSIWNTEWVYAYEEIIDKENIEGVDFLSLIENYRKINGPKSDYITLWGDKDYLSSVISKISKEISSQNSGIRLNILMVSPYNINLLNDYLRNFVVEKPWIKSIILMGESSKFQLYNAPDSVNTLKENLRINDFNMIDVNIEKDGIHRSLFISKFINNLSNQWFASDGIYMIILIPFLFTLLVIMKHLIGLSPIWVLIPIGLTLMLFKIWILSTVIIFAFFIILNLILARILNTQTLLYTPKISFILIINIVWVILLINTLIDYNIGSISVNSALYIIIYVIILEKLINVILSKEFGEYRPWLVNSIFIGLIWYVIFSSDTITTFILSYPEMILGLIPLNFLIGKFTGLRVTEYFRFREVIKTVEEE